MSFESTQLSSSLTVAQYRSLEQANDREALGRFIQERFDERYFNPIINSSTKHGFAMLAIGCLVIESLESFYQGKGDTKGQSQEMFRSFFVRNTPFKVFARDDGWFFKNIRCGILHQAETRGGWKIFRKGPLCDVNKKTINATRFLQELRRVVAGYAKQIESDDNCWQCFKNKMDFVCSNCENK
jgi:hypothetical protein